MAVDRQAHIARLRLRLRQLRADFAFVESEYKAGRISLADEVARLARITNETTIVVGEYTALVRDG
jgi:hypothetical protein